MSKHKKYVLIRRFFSYHFWQLANAFGKVDPFREVFEHVHSITFGSHFTNSVTVQQVRCGVRIIGPDHVQVFWKHTKCFGNISQLETRRLID